MTLPGEKHHFMHVNSLDGDRYMYIGNNTYFKRSKKKNWDEHINAAQIHCRTKS